MKRCTIGFLIVLALAGCSCRERPRQITETRQATHAVHATPGHVCPADGLESVVPAAMPDTHPPISPYRWELPEGWVEQMPTPLRTANFTLDSDSEVECYLTVLTGIAGGVSANVNRWRQQMGRPPLTPEDIEALPNLEMLGHASPYVEIEGDFTGMMGQPHSNYMMLAAICPLDKETVFVKMTGPIASVQAEAERFRAFCASLREGGAEHHVAVEEDE